VLTKSNTHTGGTVVGGGLLRIDNAGALGSGNLTLSGSAVLGLAAGDLTTRTVGTGAGQVQWTGSGGFAAFGANRTVSFGTPGTSIVWNATSFIGAGNTLILSHATADATLIWDQALNLLNGSRTVQVNDGSAPIDAKMSRFITGGSTVAGNIFNKTGAGTLALTANNTYNGDTNVNEGTLMIGDGGGTGGTSNATPNIIVASGATLAVNRNNTLIQGTTNLITAISGNGGFAQVGSGTTEFTLANVYKGPTAVSAGTLLINGDNSAATGAVTVAAGTATGTPVAKLGGTGIGTNGRIGGNVILTAESASGFKNGGVLAPTAAASGTKLSVAGATTFNTGSLFEWNLNAATSDTGTTNQGNYGQLAGTGVIGGSGAVFKIVLGSNNFDDAFWDTNKTWNNLFTGDGADNTLASIFSSFSGTGVSSTGVVDGQGQFSFSDTSTLHWTFTAVPEPTSALAGLLLAAGLVRRRRPVAVACNLRRLI
jgi:autotransporter-associated beta strand protein